MKITTFNRKSLYFRPWTMHFSFASKGGGVILKTEPHFRNINGFMISMPHHQIWFEFRRAMR